MLNKCPLKLINFQEHETTRKEIRRLSVVDPRLMRRFSTVAQPEIDIPLDPVADIK